MGVIKVYKTFIFIFFFMYVLHSKTIEQRKCHKHLRVAVYPTHLSI